MNIQEKFRGLMNELDTLRTKETLTADESASFKSKLAEAQTLKAQIEDQQAADALKAWSADSAGSAIKASFSGEAMPGEGDIPGVMADDTGATLYDVSSLGAAKLKTLKSAAYKDAFNAYLRARREADIPAKHMKGCGFQFPGTLPLRQRIGGSLVARCGRSCRKWTGLRRGLPGEGLDSADHCPGRPAFHAGRDSEPPAPLLRKGM